MKPYPKYKDSGIEWIVEIPEFWEVRKLKYCDYVIMGQSPNSDTYNDNFDGLPFLQGNADFTEKNPKARIWCDSSNKVALKNDILLSVRAPVGAVNIADQPYGIGRGLCSIRSKKSNLKYLYFIILNISEKLNSIATGTTYLAVSVDDIKRTYIPQPPLPEQKVIANFLDRKTKQIDTLIRKKEKLIELLKEECTAIINHAVTKGLNPDVTMKDSCIEWIGEIPEEWEVKKLKYLANAKPSNIDKKSKANEDEIFLCNYIDVYNNDFISSELDFMQATANKSQIEKFILIRGDVIATKDSETPDDIANPALVVENFDNVVCGYHLTHIKPKNIHGDYLFRQFQSKFLQAYFEISANGVTRYGIGVDKFNSVLILVPTHEEQKSIANFLDRKTAEIDSTIKKHKKLIELLKEYRTALISEVVTGKIDVR